jgi:hypothetical protein
LLFAPIVFFNWCTLVFWCLWCSINVPASVLSLVQVIGGDGLAREAHRAILSRLRQQNTHTKLELDRYGSIITVLRIRKPGRLFDPGIRDGFKIKTRIRDEHPGSYFREHRNNFYLFRLKIVKFFDADPDAGSGIFLTLDPGRKNSDPGSRINIPDPQHCKQIP